MTIIILYSSAVVAGPPVYNIVYSCNRCTFLFSRKRATSWILFHHRQKETTCAREIDCPPGFDNMPSNIRSVCALHIIIFVHKCSASEFQMPSCARRRSYAEPAAQFIIIFSVRDSTTA